MNSALMKKSSPLLHSCSHANQRNEKDARLPTIPNSVTPTEHSIFSNAQESRCIGGPLCVDSTHENPQLMESSLPCDANGNLTTSQLNCDYKVSATCASVKLMPRRRLPALCSPSPIGFSNTAASVTREAFLETNGGRKRLAAYPADIPKFAFSTIDRRSCEPRRSIAGTPGLSEMTTPSNHNEEDERAPEVSQDPCSPCLSPVQMDLDVIAMKGLSLYSPVAVRAEPATSPSSFVAKRQKGNSFSDYIASPARSMKSSFSDYVPTPGSFQQGSTPVSAGKKKRVQSPRKVPLTVLSHNSPSKRPSPFKTPLSQRPPLFGRTYLYSIDQNDVGERMSATMTDGVAFPLIINAKGGANATSPTKFTKPSSLKKRGMLGLSPKTPLPKVSLTPRKTPRSANGAARRLARSGQSPRTPLLRVSLTPRNSPRSSFNRARRLSLSGTTRDPKQQHFSVDEISAAMFAGSTFLHTRSPKSLRRSRLVPPTPPTGDSGDTILDMSIAAGSHHPSEISYLSDDDDDGFILASPSSLRQASPRGNSSDYFAPRTKQPRL